MVRVSVRNLWMRFGDVTALKNISLEVNEGELVTLLGPSGCGKTTLLRIIAGLYKPTSGRVYFDNEDVTDKPPWERNVGLVFQDYALWPHMTVFDNIVYGLKRRGVPKSEINERVENVSSLLGISELLKRYPHQLSGGQQQRVALARALVINPSVLLLDEPLSNLDAKIRVNVRTEIRKLQKKLKITTIYVTHDQEEALVLSDRVAVMRMGEVEQVGTPFEVYYNPGSAYVADFIGQVNMLQGEVRSTREGEVLLETAIGPLLARSYDAFQPGSKAYAVFRPEYVEVLREPSDDFNAFQGVVDVIQFLGNMVRVEVRINDVPLKVEIHKPLNFKLPQVEERIYLRVPPEHIRVLSR
ncbi:MAG: ABC transporter ATP-binding protein [Thermofilaceae archaeon]|uniref:ABC transporter ATP-binding protein n=1 Tax=Thermofilum sp. TaxID=1961369 RepID=UPI003164E5C1